MLAFALRVLQQTHLPVLADVRRCPSQCVELYSQSGINSAIASEEQLPSTCGVLAAQRIGGPASRKLFALGGRSRDWQGFDCVAIYDATLDQWSPGPPLPWRDHAPHAVAMRGQLYCVGNTAAVCRLDLSRPREDWRWWSLQSKPYWSGLHFMEVAAVGQHLWVLGGRKLPNTVRCSLRTGDPVRCK